MNRAHSRGFFAYFLFALIFAGALFVSPLQTFAQAPAFGPGSPSFAQTQATLGQGQTQTAGAQPADSGECSVWDWMSCLKFLNPLVLLGWIYNAALVPLFSWVLWLAAKLFDLSLILSLTTITQILKMPVIAEGWKAVRDICNLFFIFILIFISIKTILGGGSYNTKQMLGKTIVAALLINFSLYITEVIIDASNIVAVWFYNAILSLSPGSSFSDIIRQTLVLDKLFITAPSGDIFSASAWGSQLSAIAAGQLRLSIIGAAIYVFFRLTFMFIGRSVGFIILAIMSPIAFMGSVFPPLASEARDWWDEMKNNALLAPIFLLFLYITLRVASAISGPNAQSITISTGDGSVLLKPGAAPSGTFSFTNMLMVILILMLIMRCLSIAKKYSSKMGNVFSDALKNAVQLVVSLVGVGVAGKVASVAMKGATGAKLSSMAASEATGLKGFAARKIGDLGLNTLSSASKSDFGMAAARKDFAKLTGQAPRNPLTLGLTSLGSDYEKGYEGVVKAQKKKAATTADLMQHDSLTAEENVRRREAFAKTEANSIMNRINMAFDKGSRAGLTKELNSATYKENKSYINQSKTDLDVGTKTQLDKMDKLQTQLKDLNEEISKPPVPPKPGEDLQLKKTRDDKAYADRIERKKDIENQMSNAQLDLAMELVDKTELKNIKDKFVPADGLASTKGYMDNELSAGTAYSKLSKEAQANTTEKDWNESVSKVRQLQNKGREEAEKAQVIWKRAEVQGRTEKKMKEKTSEVLASIADDKPASAPAPEKKSESSTPPPAPSA